MPSEAVGLGARAVDVRVCGMGWARASRAAEELVAAGADALLSWGTAGGLDPTLDTGTIVIATEVLAESAADPCFMRFDTTAPWRDRLIDATIGMTEVVSGPVLTSRRALVSAGDKHCAFESTGALAVDMESAAVAAVAHASALPFMAVRAIVDAAEETLPRPLARALHMSRGASPRSWEIALRLLAAPTHWRAVARLSRQYRRACNALRICAPIALEAAALLSLEHHA